MTGGIKQWPEDERPREKMQQRGVEALSDAELLAVILRTGDAASKRSALDLGRELLASFGSLKALGQASLAEIPPPSPVRPQPRSGSISRSDTRACPTLR